MNGKQKRDCTAVALAILELSNVMLDDPEAFDTSLAILSKAIGTMIGSVCAGHSMEGKAVRRATGTSAKIMREQAEHIYSAAVVAAKIMQQPAAVLCGEYLDREKHGTHGGVAQ